MPGAGTLAVNPPFGSTLIVNPDGVADVTTVERATFSGRPFGSESTESTPGDGIFRNVAILEVKVMLFASGPPVSDDTFRATVVHRGEVPLVGGAAPLAQYEKVSKDEVPPVAPALGV